MEACEFSTKNMWICRSGISLQQICSIYLRADAPPGRARDTKVVVVVVVVAVVVVVVVVVAAAAAGCCLLLFVS